MMRAIIRELVLVELEKDCFFRNRSWFCSNYMQWNKIMSEL